MKKKIEMSFALNFIDQGIVLDYEDITEDIIRKVIQIEPSACWLTDECDILHFGQEQDLIKRIHNTFGIVVSSEEFYKMRLKALILRIVEKRKMEQSGNFLSLTN